MKYHVLCRGRVVKRKPCCENNVLDRNIIEMSPDEDYGDFGLGPDEAKFIGQRVEIRLVVIGKKKNRKP